jgi:chromosome segregation ATPase
MSFRKLIIILPFLWCGNATAQVSQEQTSMPEQWQMTLDGIKSKAQSLMVENNGLQDERRQLLDQVRDLLRAINDQQNRNDQMSLLLKQRHGRTDQQLRIDELTQSIKSKSPQAKVLDEQLENLRRKKSDLERKVQLLSQTVANEDLRQQAERAQAVGSPVNPQEDGQLTQLRQQLEDANKQEVLLADQLENLKTGGKSQSLSVDAIDEENKQLEARLDVLRLQKLQHERRISDVQLAQANVRMYEKLRIRKDQLEASINAYGSRLDELRESSLMALSWPLKKKKLDHELVQTDAHNNQIREKIKELREDIGILKDQVAKLERKVDSAPRITNKT